LNDLQFEARVKDSSGFGIVHVSCHFTFDNLSLCLFKLDHHKAKPCQLQQRSFVGDLLKKHLAQHPIYR
jgi:hypothetical protein